MGNDQSTEVYRLEIENDRKDEELQRLRQKYTGMKRKRDAIQMERNTALVGIGIISAVLCAVLICCTSRDSLVVSWADGKLYTDVTGIPASIIAIAVAYCAVFAAQYGIYRLYGWSSKQSSKKS